MFILRESMSLVVIDGVKYIEYKTYMPIEIAEDFKIVPESRLKSKKKLLREAEKVIANISIPPK
jgi:hypothetical protein